MLRAAVQPESGKELTTAELSRQLAAGSETASGASVTESSALRVPTVYACIRLLSQMIALLPLRVYEVDGEHETVHEDDPLDFLLHRSPNRWQTAYEFKQLIMGHLLLRGNAYVFVARAGGEVHELVPLNPANMWLEQISDLELIYHYTRFDGAQIDFSQFEIMHLRGLSTDGVVGLSPIAAAREAIGLAAQSEKHAAKLFANGARLGGVLSTEQALQQEAIERLRDQFERLYAGVENSHKTVVLEQGMQWTKVGMTAEEGQFIESRKFSRSEIAMFFGVPPHMLGDVDKSTSWGSGIEQQAIGFINNTLLPWIEAIQQAIWRDLIMPSGNSSRLAKFDTEPFTRGDFLTRQQGLEIMARNNVIDANEWRKREGMNPKPGGDGQVSGDRGAGERPAQPALPAP
ncbi:MAG: phage portal protein, partial [Phycisphaeraceae bacterium]